MSDANAIGDSARPSDRARPLRPLYGEYATPEEQRRRIEAGGGVAEAIAPAPEKAEISQPVTAPPAPEAQGPAPGSSGAGEAGAGKPRRLPELTSGRRIDRIFAFVLVIWGLFSVVRAIPQMTNYPVFAYDLFSTMGIDATLSDPSGARVWGVVSALIFGLGWLATAMLTWSSAKRGRVLFWIPLAGAIVFGMLAGFTMSIPLVNDPAVLDAITTQLTEFPTP